MQTKYPKPSIEKKDYKHLTVEKACSPNSLVQSVPGLVSFHKSFEKFGVKSLDSLYMALSYKDHKTPNCKRI